MTSIKLKPLLFDLTILLFTPFNMVTSYWAADESFDLTVGFPKIFVVPV